MQSCKRLGIVDSIVRRSTSNDDTKASSSKSEKLQADPEIKQWLDQRGRSNEKRRQAADELSSSRPRISLKNMGLTGIPQALMKMPMTAKHLSLANNNFQTAPALGDLRHLTHLDISSNLLERIPEQEIGALQNLKSLNLSHNDIKVIPYEVGDLAKLEVLDVSENSLGQLTDGQALPESIGNLSKLKELKLQGNLISKLPVQFKYLKKLEELDISNNHFQVLPMEVAQLENLRALNVANNDLRKMPQGDAGGGELYKGLRKLNVAGNPLAWLPGDFGPLQYVSISKFTVTRQKKQYEIPMPGAQLVIDISNTPLPLNTIGARLPMLTGKDVPPEPNYLPLYKAPVATGVTQGLAGVAQDHAAAEQAMPHVQMNVPGRFQAGHAPQFMPHLNPLQPNLPHAPVHGGAGFSGNPQPPRAPDAFAPAGSPGRQSFGVQDHAQPSRTVRFSDEFSSSDSDEDLAPAHARQPSSSRPPVVEMPVSGSESVGRRRAAASQFQDSRPPMAAAAAVASRFQGAVPQPGPFQAPLPGGQFQSAAYLSGQFQSAPYQPGLQAGAYNYNMLGQNQVGAIRPGVLPQTAIPQLPLLTALLSNMQVAPARPFLQTSPAFFQPSASRSLFDYSAPRPGLPQGIGNRPIKNLHLDALLQTHPVVLPDPMRPDLLPIEPALLDKYVRTAKRGDRPQEDLKHLGIMLYVMKTINQEAVNSAEINVVRKNDDPLSFNHRETDARRIALVYQTLVAREHQILPVLDIRSHWEQEPRFVTFFDGIVAPDQVQPSRQYLLTAVSTALANEYEVEKYLEGLPFWQAYGKEQIDNAADAWRKQYPRV